mmetsp:Transcript_65497/g.188424  ORF Transcript_65497/g.188424 Transcript_65497/m.188424 type:complete len:213 (+) Transcript_65497:171-809(+)
MVKRMSLTVSSKSRLKRSCRLTKAQKTGWPKRSMPWAYPFFVACSVLTSSTVISAGRVFLRHSTYFCKPKAAPSTSPFQAIRKRRQVFASMRKPPSNSPKPSKRASNASAAADCQSASACGFQVAEPPPPASPPAPLARRPARQCSTKDTTRAVAVEHSARDASLSKSADRAMNATVSMGTKIITSTAIARLPWHDRSSCVLGRLCARALKS